MVSERLWTCKDAEDGVEGVYAAVHIVKWHRHPDQPKVLFGRATVGDVAREPAVAALVEAACSTRDWLAGDMGLEANSHWYQLKEALAAFEEADDA